MLLKTISCALVMLSASIAFAGELDPPAGPIAPTPGPEPRTAINAVNTPGDANALFVITQPGSYYLEDNLQGVINLSGIRITASDVTIDLMGFAVIGDPDGLNGINVSGNGHSGIKIHNGTVRNWGGTGIDLKNGPGAQVEGIRAISNGSFGILVGLDAIVTGCVARLNGGDGISGIGRAVISNCVANDNLNGIKFSGSGVVITDCTANGNTTGIQAPSGSRITGCSAADNTSFGIRIGTGGTVVHSTAFSNGTGGIFLSFDATVRNCTANRNDGDGIRASNDCLIQYNSCGANGFAGDGAGIHVTGFSNRIEGNNCTLSDRGIDVDDGGNIIIKNTCRGNTTNWDIVANNRVGPIVNAPNSAAISGNTGGAGVGSTNPWANFSY